MQVYKKLRVVENILQGGSVFIVMLMAYGFAQLSKLEMKSAKKNRENFVAVSLDKTSALDKKKLLVNFFFSEFEVDFKKYHKGVAKSVDLSNIDVYFRAFPQVRGPRPLAVCFSNPKGRRAIIFDTVAMLKSSYTQLKMTTYHELGHCALDLDHDETVSTYYPKENLIKAGAKSLTIPATLHRIFGFSGRIGVPGPKSLMFPSTFPEEFVLDYPEHFMKELFNREPDYLTRVKCDNASRKF